MLNRAASCAALHTLLTKASYVATVRNWRILESQLSGRKGSVHVSQSCDLLVLKMVGPTSGRGGPGLEA